MNKLRRDALEYRRVRVGLYATALPQTERKPGGVDVYVDRLADRLARRGHRVTVFTYSHPLPNRAYALHRLEPASMADSKLRRLLVAPARLNAVDTAGLDVLHLHGDDWFYLRRRLPTVRTFHGSALYEARNATRVRRRASQLALYPMELLSARLATASYGIIPGDGPGYRTLGHLNLGIDLPGVDGHGSAAPTVLFVGTWQGRKRGELLHEAFLRHVLPRLPDAQLVMVSDHCEPGPGIRWVSRPSDEELAALYAAAAVFCLPSAYEGFGVPYLEAMAHGTPVVSTPNPGARFVLDDGRCGVIANEEHLGEEILRLLLDDSARLALARRGRERALEFSWDAAIERHERAYRDAVERFRAGQAGNGFTRRQRGGSGGP